MPRFVALGGAIKRESVRGAPMRFSFLLSVFFLVANFTASHAASDTQVAPVVLTLNNGAEIKLPATMQGSWYDSGYGGDVTIISYGATSRDTFNGRFQFGGSDSKCSWFNDFTGRLLPNGSIVLESDGCGETKLELSHEGNRWVGSASWFEGNNTGEIDVK